jgi:hypothetical protein
MAHNRGQRLGKQDCKARRWLYTTTFTRSSLLQDTEAGQVANGRCLRSNCRRSIKYARGHGDRQECAASCRRGHPRGAQCGRGTRWPHSGSWGASALRIRPNGAPPACAAAVRALCTIRALSDRPRRSQSSGPVGPSPRPIQGSCGPYMAHLCSPWTLFTGEMS